MIRATGRQQNEKSGKKKAAALGGKGLHGSKIRSSGIVQGQAPLGDLLHPPASMGTGFRPFFWSTHGDWNRPCTTFLARHC